MTKEKVFIVYRESFVQSVAADVVSIGLLVAAIWFNYEFIGGSYFMNGIILVLFILKAITKFTNSSTECHSKEDVLSKLELD